ncbi:hypothetical protein BOX15_Mlig025973g1, partial [Macrostomum lignano]
CTMASSDSSNATGPGGVPQGSKTSEYYAVQNIPDRFDNPDWFKGYGNVKPVHPMYRTTASDYGKMSPTVHTMPTTFHPVSQTFSEKLGKCGMYRNHSMNTGKDRKLI